MKTFPQTRTPECSGNQSRSLQIKTALRKIVWKRIDAMQQVKSFIGEFEHRISLLAVREELGCIGPIYEPHGDLIGRRVMVGRGRLWKRSDSSALSFPASVLIGPVFDDGIPY